MNEVRLQGNLARDCSVTDGKNGGKNIFMTVNATRDGGRDYVPVKAFDVSEAMIAVLKKGLAVSVLGRFGTGKYDKEQKVQVYNNVVVAYEIKCGGVGHTGGVGHSGGGVWTEPGFAAVSTAPAGNQSGN